VAFLTCIATLETSSRKHRKRISTFPGTIEVLTNKPICALENAYREHTAQKMDQSRLVLWTDGSASGGRKNDKYRGFAVAWRRTTEQASWSGWEVAGYQGMFAPEQVKIQQRVLAQPAWD
jgi:hypothetical protein